MKSRLLIFISICTIIMACKSEKPTEIAATPIKLTPVPEQFIVDAFNTIDHIDYLFRGTNFSVSQSEEGAIKQTISLMSTGEVTHVDPSCKPQVRMTYLSKGNIIFDTEMYLDENCLFVEYYIDNKKTYQSSFSQEGYNFILNIIKSATSGREG